MLKGPVQSIGVQGIPVDLCHRHDLNEIGHHMEVILYFMKTVSAEISAYIGFGTLTAQIGATGGILLLLLLSYFLCTWMLFQRSIEEGTHTNP